MTGDPFGAEHQRLGLVLSQRHGRQEKTGAQQVSKARLAFHRHALRLEAGHVAVERPQGNAELLRQHHARHRPATPAQRVHEGKQAFCAGHRLLGGSAGKQAALPFGRRLPASRTASAASPPLRRPGRGRRRTGYRGPYRPQHPRRRAAVCRPDRAPAQSRAAARPRSCRRREAGHARTGAPAGAGRGRAWLARCAQTGGRGGPALDAHGGRPCRGNASRVEAAGSRRRSRGVARCRSRAEGSREP